MASLDIVLVSLWSFLQYQKQIYIIFWEMKQNFKKNPTFSLDDASIDIIDMQTDSTVKAGLQSSERIERQI